MATASDIPSGSLPDITLYSLSEGRFMFRFIEIDFTLPQKNIHSPWYKGQDGDFEY